MKIEKSNTVASQVLRDLEHTNLATFSLNEVELVNIDGENFFARGLICYSLEIVLNGQEIILNSYGHTFKPYSDLKRIQVDDLWIFYNPRKVLFYDNTHSELLGEVSKIIDPRNQRERLQDLTL